MAQLEQMQQASINRSIRTIKAELEYLCDASIITPGTLSDLLSRIPPQTALHAPLSVGAIPPPSQNNANAMQNLNLNKSNSNSRTNGTTLNEKQGPAYSQAPPAYNPSPSPAPPQANWPPLAQATALYQYSSSDVGDLELQPNDHITVTEFMNAEWWKGRSSRTGLEGIFPRSYVKVVEEKSGASGSAYGNVPLEVSGMGNGEGQAPSKAQGE